MCRVNIGSTGLTCDDALSRNNTLHRRNGCEDEDIRNMESLEDVSKSTLLLRIEEGIRELDHGEKVDLDEAIAILEERLALSNSSQ